MQSEMGVIQVAEPKDFFGHLCKVNKCCHKNVIVPSDSGAEQSSCWSRKLTFSAGRVERKKWSLRFGAEYSSTHNVTMRPTSCFLSSDPKSCMASTELLRTPSAAVETSLIGTSCPE